MNNNYDDLSNVQQYKNIKTTGDVLVCNALADDLRRGKITYHEFLQKLDQYFEKVVKGEKHE